MKTIGTDINLDVCKAEGYTMIQYDARKKFNKDMQIRVFNYYPEYCEEIGGTIMNDVNYSFDELVALYKKCEGGCNSFAETNKFINFTDPGYYDFLNLASDLISYRGL